MVSGNCNCGAIQFEIDTDVSDVYVCHCSICRRFTGSSGIAVVLVQNSQFKWIAGQECVTRWKKPGADWESWFCRICGSAVPGVNDPKKMFVPAGSITSGVEHLRVAHHVWVGSKAAWDVIGDNGMQHPEGFRAQPGKAAADDGR
jgi:hypothetical protein